MERKLRYRFVAISMLSLVIVLLVLLGGTNIANFFVVTQQQDKMLHSIADNDSHVPEKLPNGPFGGPPSPEARSFTRFFKVTADGEGNVKDVFLEHVSSISEQDAIEYATQILAKNRTKGYCGEYRYYKYQEGKDTVLIFLNSGIQLQNMRTILLISGVVLVVCFLFMFVLVLALSKRAVAPYVRNLLIQKRFITDAGHELKTPITAITTSADILAYNDSENEWIKNIQAQTIRLSKLVNHLVTMSRLDEEMPIPDKVDFSLSDALWESVEPFDVIAKAKGRKMEKKIADGLTLHGDVVTIQQVISILLDNAIKYSNEGGEIRFSAYRKKQKNIIEVYNTCNTIDTRNLNRVFERFYRGDQSRSSTIAGTGVGLSIAQAIVRAHGGSITVRSDDGHSIFFIIVL